MSTDNFTEFEQKLIEFFKKKDPLKTLISLKELKVGASGQHRCWKLERKFTSTVVIRTQDFLSINYDLAHQYTVLNLVFQRDGYLVPKPLGMFVLETGEMVLFEEYLDGFYLNAEAYQSTKYLELLIGLLRNISRLSITPEVFPFRKYMLSFDAEWCKWQKRLFFLRLIPEKILAEPLAWTRNFYSESLKMFCRPAELLAKSTPCINHTGTYLENINVSEEGMKIHSWSNVLYGNPTFMLARFCSQNPSREKLISRLDEIVVIFLQGKPAFGLSESEFRELLLWSILEQEVANIAWIMWKKSYEVEEARSNGNPHDCDVVLPDLKERIRYTEDFKKNFLT